ncbi:DUF6993 domain-containing protein [uncultured Gulosibacter sp.]|uniref:DUF6993 domain-containing protein n=1 Tax=uncultured Gulosibacter sp. TaxID=1339167 RepID=UPI00288BF930|nr:hypothetical protein [uncultured Gulosibacter sp.]
MSRFKNFPRLVLLPTSALLVVSALLVGCTGDRDAGPVNATTAAEATPTKAPEFVPDGGAEANHAYFDATLKQLLEKKPGAGSKDLVNTLVEAGFDKSKMEVTSDTTPIGLDTTFVIVSVHMPDNMCLLGERGPDGSYASLVTKPISSGKCQLAKSIDIDW